MTKPVVTEQDNLAHIDAGAAAPDHADPALLRNQVSATDGSITIVSGFGCSVVLNWSFGSDALNAQVQLQTPFGSITLIDATINPQKPSITFGGGKWGFKAEGTISLDFGDLVLTASGEVCAFGQCKSGSVSISV